MRIAVLADIHGNLAALEAVLQDVAGHEVDEVVVAGDVVNGAPDSRACWDLLRSLGYPMLRGNHERYLYELYSEHAKPEWDSERFAPVQWTHRQFDPSQLQEMTQLPMCLRLPQAPDLLFVHASPHSDRDAVLSDTSQGQLDEMFAGAGEPLIVRGHNHMGAVRKWRGRTVVTAGSVGLPLDGSTTAKYLLLECNSGIWRHRWEETAYDLDSALARFRDTGYLSEAGPMARLFMEELATAQLKMTPFLREFERLSNADPPPLSEAVDRFLKGSLASV